MPLIGSPRNNYRGADRPKEVHARPVPETQRVRGSRDLPLGLSEGFFLAEIMKFDHLGRLGSVPAVRENGLMRIEGWDCRVTNR
ncbi:MAG: DUF933 domain-containing protein [Bacteroidetes bacterium]|nr:DUF933 domain-containing protein [Bacteroidota bacterium]MCW5896917.1 DUF933 domain-containing protein [Bacteroidota bacterium]